MNKDPWRITDTIFFGTIGFSLFYVLVIAMYNIPPPYVSIWILYIPLYPVAMAKAFFPRSKFTGWLEHNKWRPK